MHARAREPWTTRADKIGRGWARNGGRRDSGRTAGGLRYKLQVRHTRPRSCCVLMQPATPESRRAAPWTLDRAMGYLRAAVLGEDAGGRAGGETTNYQIARPAGRSLCCPPAKSTNERRAKARVFSVGRPREVGPRRRRARRR
ncbi:hypothetical protein CERSUDRAFT_120347 [Gelatoporia subvermispora B]|uniref:Uncharacterized protein n=1 Tax=Ceriporiopsis subvermispora (strain B) TaxID=914234 RepID=M2QF92_CERS8|nr:hypothetical protein CERSUDRAFT_120347 [Gelatoporia subvermispora B]